MALRRALVVAEVADMAGVADIVEAVVGWDKELVGVLEIVRRCRALVGEPCQSKESVAASPFDFVFVVVLDFVFVVLFVAVFAVAFAGIARGFRRLAGFSSFPQVVR